MKITPFPRKAMGMIEMAIQTAQGHRVGKPRSKCQATERFVVKMGFLRCVPWSPQGQ